jgi:hypothetical protein
MIFYRRPNVLISVILLICQQYHLCASNQLNKISFTRTNSIHFSYYCFGVEVTQYSVIFNIQIIGAYDWSGNNAIIPELWMLPHFLPIHPGIIY